MKITDGLLNRATRDFKHIAKEDLTVEHVKGTLYIFGSELATLRLFSHYNKYKRNSKTRQDFSLNRKSHYFALDIDI